MKVKVCDALCGSGKTMSCVNMMNSCTDKRFIFITPYLDEVERIKKACASRRFVSPEKKARSKYSKANDIVYLLKEGVNIASTHALFACYTDEIKNLIRDQNYILVLDEVIDLFQPVETDSGDIDFLVRNDIVKKDGDSIIWDDEEYDGILFSEIAQKSKSRNLVDYDGSFFFWSLPIDVFKCFSEAYVLTYMFEYQMLKYFFDANGVEYELIGTKKEEGVFTFCPIEQMDRARDLRDLIHIYDDAKACAIGDEQFSLSSSWFNRAKEEYDQISINTLKNCTYNFFRNSKSSNEDKMWTTFNKYRGLLKGKGYSNGFITFNKRASNEFSSRHYLAYCVNVYMMPWMKNYLARIGAKNINQDMYALSILIQWVFRSAIRSGEEIWVYIPSLRMRYLLNCWLDNLYRGEDLKPIHFKVRQKKNESKLSRAAQIITKKREGK